MRHGHKYITTVDSWMIGLLIIVFLIILVAIIRLIRRNRKAANGLTPSERKNLDYRECEILTLLRQFGGPMLQTEIVESLPIDFEELVECIRQMEIKGLIHRVWETDKETYTVSESVISPKNSDEKS